MINDPNSAIASQLTITIDGQLTTFTEGETIYQVASRSPRGTVFTSFSFADTNVNILTGSGYDPVTQTAELKVCPVRIRPS